MIRIMKNGNTEFLTYIVSLPMFWSFLINYLNRSEAIALNLKFFIYLSFRAVYYGIQ